MAGVRRITSFGTVTKRLVGFDPTWFDYRVGQPIKYRGPKK